MECTYQEGDTQDTLSFTRSGVTGTLLVDAQQFDMTAKLGFLFSVQGSHRNRNQRPARRAAGHAQHHFGGLTCARMAPASSSASRPARRAAVHRHHHAHRAKLRWVDALVAAGLREIEVGSFIARQTAAANGRCGRGGAPRRGRHRITVMALAPTCAVPKPPCRPGALGDTRVGQRGAHSLANVRKHPPPWCRAAGCGATARRHRTACAD